MLGNISEASDEAMLCYIIEHVTNVHSENEGNQFNWDSVTKCRHAQEFLEAWFSTHNAINKPIELDPIYKPIQNKTGNDTTVQSVM
eukprot:g47251.t1